MHIVIWNNKKLNNKMTNEIKIEVKNDGLEVCISEGNNKFVHFYDPEKNKEFIKSRYADHHKQMVPRKFQRQGPGAPVRGGRMHYSPEDKTLFISDRSMQYGAANRHYVKKLLEETLGEEFKIGIEPYVDDEREKISEEDPKYVQMRKNAKTFIERIPDYEAKKRYSSFEDEFLYIQEFSLAKDPEIKQALMKSYNVRAILSDFSSIFRAPTPESLNIYFEKLKGIGIATNHDDKTKVAESMITEYSFRNYYSDLDGCYKLANEFEIPEERVKEILGRFD